MLLFNSAFFVFAKYIQRISIHCLTGSVIIFSSEIMEDFNLELTQAKCNKINP